MNRTTLLGVIAAALCLAACGPTAVPVPSTPPATVTAAPTVTPDPSFEALVAEGVRVREMLGLRADEEWVRAVTADPGARTTFGVPLTLAEEGELGERATSRQELQPVLEQYGAEHPKEYAGLMIDQKKDGMLVILFTGHLEEHAAAIAKLVRPGAKLEVRRAGAASAELEALMNRINSDSDALQSVGVFVLAISTDELAGKLIVEVSTERGDAQPLLAARFGPNVEVKVTDPTGSYLPPSGEIRGHVLDRNGDGVQANIGSEPLFAKDLPRDSIGPPETEPDGTFVLDDMLPGRWRITALGGFDDVSVEVDVPPGGVATVELVVDP